MRVCANAPEDFGAAREPANYCPAEQVPERAFTEVTCSIPPLALDPLVLIPEEPEPVDPLPDADPPLAEDPDPLPDVPAVDPVPELVPDPLPMPLVPALIEESIRPRTSTRCPTCLLKLLPDSITFPDVLPPVTSVSMYCAPLEPVEPVEPPALDPEPPPDALPLPDMPDAPDPLAFCRQPVSVTV
jgi:hypothetical protein